MRKKMVPQKMSIEEPNRPNQPIYNYFRTETRSGDEMTRHVIVAFPFHLLSPTQT